MVGVIAAPGDLPIGLYRIGPVALVTLSGEFTSMMGQGISTKVRETLTPAPMDILTIGLANEYLSYFTTSEEFELQHDEGASTLYGRDSGSVVAEEIRRLAEIMHKPLWQQDQRREYRHKVGFTRRFSELALDRAFQSPLVRSLSNILLDLDSGMSIADTLPKICWCEPVANFRMSAGAPTSVVERQAADGTWHPLTIAGAVENDDGTRLVYGVDEVHDGSARSCVYWLPPDNLRQRGPYRISVHTAGRQEVHSDAFGGVGEVALGDDYHVARLHYLAAAQKQVQKSVKLNALAVTASYPSAMEEEAA